MAGPFARFLRRSPEAPTVWLERFRPIEPPVLTEVKRRLVRGDVDGGLRYAYPLVLDDLQRAYGVAFPPDWTHEEILRYGVPPGAGPVAEFLPRLYELYAPTRYGPAGPQLRPQDGAEALELLRSIYAVAPMWRLYAWHAPSGLARLFPPRHPAPEAVPASDEPASPTDPPVGGP